MEQEKLIREVLKKSKHFYVKLKNISIKINDSLEVSKLLTNKGEKNYSLKSYINLVNEGIDLLPATSTNLCNLINNIVNKIDSMSLSLLDTHCNEIDSIINKVLKYRKKVKSAKVTDREYIPAKKVLLEIIDIILNNFSKFVCEISIFETLTVEDAYKPKNIKINLEFYLPPNKVRQLNTAVKLLNTNNPLAKLFYKLSLPIMI